MQCTSNKNDAYSIVDTESHEMQLNLFLCLCVCVQVCVCTREPSEDLHV